MHPTAVRVLGTLVLLFAASGVSAQPATVNRAGVRTGVLPERWPLDEPSCVDVPEFHIHQYNDDFYILRQSGRSNFEQPFLYLLFGNKRAILFDTGAENTQLKRYAREIIDKWLQRNGQGTIELIVTHLHTHPDHIAGDKQFKDQPNTTLVTPDVESVKTFFGIKNWPDQVVEYDLGDRVLDIIPIPGHDEMHIAVYDRQTGVLLTEDTLYPGRIYVNSALPLLVQSVERLTRFTEGKVVAHVLGTHIEQTRTPYVDYPIGTTYQPEEHMLELSRGHLLEMLEALRGMKGKLAPVALRHFTICRAYPNC